MESELNPPVKPGDVVCYYNGGVAIVADEPRTEKHIFVQSWAHQDQIERRMPGAWVTNTHGSLSQWTLHPDPDKILALYCEAMLLDNWRAR